MSSKPMVFGHIEDMAIEVENGFKFSLDIPTPYPINLEKLDEEAKAAVCFMHEGQRIQATPASKRSLGNYGAKDPMQAWDATCHYDSVYDACLKATQFWDMLSHHQPLMGFNLRLHHV